MASGASATGLVDETRGSALWGRLGPQWEPRRREQRAE